MKLTKQMIEKLQKLAKKSACGDDEEWYAGDGGNHDDTYQTGIEDGEIYLAREILNTSINEKGL